MDYGSSQHIKLIFKQKYFDTNMNKNFLNIIRKMLKWYLQENTKNLFPQEYYFDNVKIILM